MAISPDGHYVAILNNGYGTTEDKGLQSIAVLNIETNDLADFPDARFGEDAPQTFFAGLAFSLDGHHLYASVASLTDPQGHGHNALGNGIAVYSFNDGKIVPERFIKVPLVEISSDRTVGYGKDSLPAHTANPFPAGISVFSAEGKEQILVADNLSDTATVVDVASGQIASRFDLFRRKGIVPSRFPYRVAIAPDGRTAWCGLWNDSAVVELGLQKIAMRRPAKNAKFSEDDALHRVALTSAHDEDRTGSHPNALLLSRDGRYLFVTLATRDVVAVIDTETAKEIGEVSTKLPGQQYEGAYPDALAMTPDGKSLFVADATADTVIQYDIPAQLNANSLPTVKAYIPTEWYPISLAVVGNDLLIATGKGKSSGGNPPDPTDKKHRYIASLMHGSLARVSIGSIAAHADEYKQQIVEENRLSGRSGEITFSAGKNPIHHLIYIIKENRTYDQIFGDLGVGNGDPDLTMFGEDITPNQHALARQFGVLDNFYDSGEVSGNGHVWSTAAITSDYTELDWPISYRSDPPQRTYDFEGKVGDIYPVEHDEDDINEPGTGYLWTNAARHHLTYRHYGEYIDTQWCEAAPQNSPASTGESAGHCAKIEIKPGESLPSNVGTPHGSASQFPWPIPMIAGNIPTKRELRKHFDPNYADFELDYPDQLRTDEFLNEFNHFVEHRNAGKGEQLPNLVVLRLPNDHTAGTRPGLCTPQACVADNDLAVGRVVDAISHSPYWDDTAIFILEDDAQDGADHVDAHRSIALVISKYAPHAQQPYVEHNFYTTVNVVRTMESLLGLPPMNHNDGQAAVMSGVFTGDGSQPAFDAIYRNRDNKLIYQANTVNSPGATQSMLMDFSKEDRADPQQLNAILWRVTKGDVPMPAPKHTLPLR
jgi:DNA-binding beta-propeller fold protein YncE